MKAAFFELRLVYPPISNQEGDWLRALEDGAERELLRDVLGKSNLYMLGHRPEVCFAIPMEAEGEVDFDALIVALEIGGQEQLFLHLTLEQKVTGLTSECWIPLIALLARDPSTLDPSVTEFNHYFEIGPKLIRLVNSSTDEVIEWLTPDKLLFDYWQGRLPVIGLDNRRQLTQFQLLYVGISRSNNSFSRLFETPHHARLSILTNETQLHPTARLSDEVVAFMFTIADWQMVLAKPGEEIDFEFLCNRPDRMDIVADAEKALVHTLGTKYNHVEYANYPESADGLYEYGIDRYYFILQEDLTFVAGDKTLLGDFTPNMQTSAIVVTGDSVQFGQIGDFIPGL